MIPKELSCVAKKVVQLGYGGSRSVGLRCFVCFVFSLSSDFDRSDTCIEITYFIVSVRKEIERGSFVKIPLHKQNPFSHNTYSNEFLVAYKKITPRWI